MRVEATGFHPAGFPAAEQLHMHADQVPRFLPHQRIPAVAPAPLGADDLADFVTHGRREVRGRKAGEVLPRDYAARDLQLTNFFAIRRPRVTGYAVAIPIKPCSIGDQTLFDRKAG